MAFMVDYKRMGGGMRIITGLTTNTMVLVMDDGRQYVLSLKDAIMLREKLTATIEHIRRNIENQKEG